MTDEDLKRLFDETRRHFDLVAERIENKFQLVAEGVVTTNERIDRVDSKVDRLAADMKNEFSEV